MELPHGWSVAEAAILTTPSGQTVEAYVGPVHAGSGPAELLDHEVEVARALIGAVDVSEPVRARLRGGHSAESRDLRFDHDGTEHIVRIACAVVGDHAMRFVGRWVADDATAPIEFDAAVAGAFVWSRAVEIASGDGVSGDAADQPISPSVRPPIQQETWRQLREIWSAGAPAGASAALTDITRWSTYELIVAAAMTGGDTFPTIDGGTLAAAPRPAVDAVTQAVLASLLARDLAEHAADGRLHPAGSLAPVTDVALAPDLVLWIQRDDGDSPYGWWIGVRPDVALQLAVLPDGGRESSWLAPVAVVDHALDLITATPAMNAPGMHVPSTTTVTALWHEGAVVRGGVFAWTVDDHGATALGDEQVWDGDDSPCWHLDPAPIDALRGHLLGYLPGDDSGG